MAKAIRRGTASQIEEGNLPHPQSVQASGRDPQSASPVQTDESVSRSAARSDDDAAEALSVDDALDVDSASGSEIDPFDGGLSDDDRRRMIAEAAYYIAQRRDFDGGLELDDWLAAEAEVNARLHRRPLPE